MLQKWSNMQISHWIWSWTDRCNRTSYRKYDCDDWGCRGGTFSGGVTGSIKPSDHLIWTFRKQWEKHAYNLCTAIEHAAGEALHTICRVLKQGQQMSYLNITQLWRVQSPAKIWLKVVSKMMTLAWHLAELKDQHDHNMGPTIDSDDIYSYGPEQS